MFRRRHLIYAAPILLVSSCKSMEPPGPGVILTYTSLIEGRSISVKQITLSNGSPWSNPVTVFGVKRTHWRDGSTFGASGDHRNLPEWVEIEWSEPVYPEDPKQTLEEYRALPRQKQRVVVRERVPQDVVQQAIDSRLKSPPDKVPELLLWLYFVWTDTGIKFAWELCRGSFAARAGGDDIDAM